MPFHFFLKQQPVVYTGTFMLFGKLMLVLCNCSNCHQTVALEPFGKILYSSCNGLEDLESLFYKAVINDYANDQKTFNTL